LKNSGQGEPVLKPNLRAPDLSWISFSGGSDIIGAYKNCRKICVIIDATLHRIS
jgi:hypothetical protein